MGGVEVEYLKSCQAPKMERFAKIVNGQKLLIIFAKYLTLEILQGSEYASA